MTTPTATNAMTAWLRNRVSAGEDLDRPKLAHLVAALGGAPELWAHLVRHDPEERYFVQLHRDAHLDLWLICWQEQQETGYHDHDISSGAVYVSSGILAEDRFRFEGRNLLEATRERGAGSVFDFDAAYIHRMRHVGGGTATSVHAYSPALWRMGYYEQDENGSLCRTSITYADEVGPLPSHP